MSLNALTIDDALKLALYARETTPSMSFPPEWFESTCACYLPEEKSWLS